MMQGKYLENRIKTKTIKDQKEIKTSEVTKVTKRYRNISKNQRPQHVTLYMEGEKQRYPSLEIMKTYLAFS